MVVSISKNHRNGITLYGLLACAVCVCVCVCVSVEGEDINGKFMFIHKYY